MLAPTPELLAPGDARALALDPGSFEWHRVRSVEDPQFLEAYEALWAEFGASNELETQGVITGRLALGLSMRYEMVIARSAGRIAAVRDHTAIWFEDEVIVHLSHVLISHEWRRTGLAGWMRAVPAATGQEVAVARGVPDAPITLVAEMEHDDGSVPSRGIRLAAYERAGFLKIDPSRVLYHQPDFRPPDAIDTHGGARPLPFQLVIRQVGEEQEQDLEGPRVRKFVRALYHMYGAQFRRQDMTHGLLQLEGYPADTERVRLIQPTA